MEREIKDKTELTKKQIFNTFQLEEAMSDAENVLVVTHDYFAVSPCKLAFLRGASKLAKDAGAKRIVAVNPVEYDMYSKHLDYEEARGPKVDLWDHCKTPEEAYEYFNSSLTYQISPQQDGNQI